MRERKGEYFLKIVNEERYQQLFDHPEELRKIITYAKRLMQYEKCFDYSFRDNCMKMELLQVAVQRILQEYGIEVGEVYDLSIEWIESDDEDDFMIQNIDEPLMKHCIFTTGTVLISRSALSKADVLPGCFVEPVFNTEKARWQIVGATGFYFLEA